MRIPKIVLGLLIGVSALAAACGANASEPSSVSPTRSSPTSTSQATSNGAQASATAQATPTSSTATAVSPTTPGLVSFSHAPGEHRGPLTIELFAENAATIRYTTDGSDPAGSDALTFDGPITLLESATVRAIALAENGTRSQEASAAYEVVLAKLDQPRLDSNGGVFGAPQTVTIESGEPDAVVYYTLDGTTPSATNGDMYQAPITISETAQLSAVNVRPGMIDSDVRSIDFRIYGRLVERTGDIELTGDQEMIIEDTLFLHEGNINLSGNAKLVVRNSFVRHVKEFAFQYGVNASGNSRVVFEDSAIGSNCTGSFNYSILENATLSASNVDIGRNSCNVWVFMSGTAAISIDSWDGFGGTVCDGSNVAIENSDTLEVELCFPEDSVIDTSLPISIDTFAFGPDPANSVEFSLSMSNVAMDGWGINVLPGADITIRDSDAITIGIIVGGRWSNETVELDGLALTRYDNKTWQIGPDASLTLVNTNVYGWEPNAFADNTIVITNSDYAASAVNSGDAHYEISDSTVDLISAGERVTMTITNTIIRGDVIANDDAVIILINCEVRGVDNGDDGLFGGNVFARGNGKVILRNTTVAGEMIEQESGQIVVE